MGRQILWYTFALVALFLVLTRYEGANQLLRGLGTTYGEGVGVLQGRTVNFGRGVGAIAR